MIELSVIIPMYKGKKYIKNTVESITKINCEKEILIIDDGSPDDSYLYCCEVFKKFQDVIVLKKKNGGIVETRNFGIKHAKGEYILFSDQDDICYAETIEKALLKARDNQADVMLWSTVYLLPDGTLEQRDTVYTSKVFHREDIQTLFIQDMILNVNNRVVSYLGHVWQGLYKRKLIEDNKIQFKKFVDIEDDYLFLFDAICASMCVVTIEDIGYAWRYNRKSETYRLKHIDDLILKYEKLYMYIWLAVSHYSFSKEIEARFWTYVKQETVIRGMENSYTFIAHSKSEKKMLKDYYHENVGSFQIDAVYPYEKKRKRIFVLLKKHMYVFAAGYVYLDSIRRKIKNTLR